VLQVLQGVQQRFNQAQSGGKRVSMADLCGRRLEFVFF